MFHRIFSITRDGATGVGWHHLPALYMLDFHVVVLATVLATAIATMLLLTPTLRRPLSTLFVVITCLTTGFLGGYSLFLPDWQSAYASLPPSTLGYHFSTPKVYSLHLGIHIGLTGANITLLARPIKGFQVSPKELHYPGCLRDLNPRECRQVKTEAVKFFSGMTATHSRPQEMGHFSLGSNRTLSTSPFESLTISTGRKLMVLNRDVEGMYSERRGKPVHFSRSDTGGHVNLEKHHVSDSSVSTQMASSKKESKEPKITGALNKSGDKGTTKRVALAAVSQDAYGSAWYDEKVDWTWGKGSGGSHLKMLRKGVPDPILAVSEYLSSDWNYGSGGGEGAGLYGGYYDLGARLRKAGHFTACLLIASLITWAFSIPIQMSEPESGAKLLGLSGLMMLAAAPMYACMLGPSPSENLRVSGVLLHLRWGGCFYASVFGGLWAAMVGFFLAFIRHSFPGSVATDLDLDELKDKENQNKVRPVIVPDSEGLRLMLEFT